MGLPTAPDLGRKALMRFIRPAAAAAVAAVAAGTLAMAGPASAGPLSAARAPAPAVQAAQAAAQSFTAKSGAWGKARAIPGLAALSKGAVVSSSVSQVSCASPGNCAAAGSYFGADGHNHPFIAEEKNGTWGGARRLSGLNSLDKGGAVAFAVSCPSPGNCAAAGTYTDATGQRHVFAAGEKNGTWGSAHKVGFGQLDPGGAEIIDALSCASPGNCAMAGSYVTAGGTGEPFVASEKNGTWAQAIQVPGVGAANSGGFAVASSVSCWSAGACAVGGYYEDSAQRFRPFAANETGGRWGRFQAIAVDATIGTDDAAVTSVSCVRPGDCALTGNATATGQVFVADKAGGTWGAAKPVPGSVALNPGKSASAESISCASPGYCATAGQLANPTPVAYVADERSGGWDFVEQVFGGSLDGFNTSSLAFLTSVSCGSPGNCAATGSYDTANKVQLAFVVNEVNGSWGNAIQVPGLPALPSSAQGSSISCAAPGNCAVGGENNGRAFVADQSTVTSTALTLSAATIRTGHEQAEKISVQARPRTSGTPGGTVTVKAGSTTACVITLAGGKGTCTLKASQLRAGSYQLTARYSGSQVYGGSRSAARKLTVTR
jgi:hypothetical protein